VRPDQVEDRSGNQWSNEAWLWRPRGGDCDMFTTPPMPASLEAWRSKPSPG